MQQYLPFTVLKLEFTVAFWQLNSAVATVLTVYGIETKKVAYQKINSAAKNVATVLTVYGIETNDTGGIAAVDSRLQQYLPFTVLKRQII